VERPVTLMSRIDKYEYDNDSQYLLSQYNIEFGVRYMINSSSNLEFKEQTSERRLRL
jgi:hypothetical protein